MNEAILKHLGALYGADDSAPVANRLAGFLHSHRRGDTPKPARQHLPLDQRDALLITYGDQVSEPGRPPLQTLSSFARQHLRDVVSGVHILPFYPYSSDDGFSVIDYLKVDPALGTWSDVERLGADFDLMFDAVFNHMSAKSEWFQKFLNDDPAFRDTFVTVDGNPDLSNVVRPRALPLLTEFQSASGTRKVWTTFSADQVDVNVKNPTMLLLLLEVLLFYVARGAKFIRLDAIAYLWKEIGTSCIHLPQTHQAIQLMRAVLDEVAPQVLLITETNVPHRDNISYFGDGSNEAQLVYNFSLPPLTLHSLLTGDATALTRWAKSLVLPGPRTTWFNFLASHDGIGVNPARGLLSDAEIDALAARVQEHGGFISYKNMPDGSQLPYEMNINYLDALSNPAAKEPVELAARKFLTAQSIMLSLQGLPAVYFHSLFGSRGDRQAALDTGIKRRINREKLKLEPLERDLADAQSLRSHVFGAFRELLAKRRAHPAFSPAAPQQILELDPRVFAVLRESADGKDRVLCLHNVSDNTVRVNGNGKHFAECVLKAYETKWVSSSR
ncbi:MAG TPA: sugar phosphorylase [Verrucomicrobiota bacterium]|nr:sugar phosphorylase [Verrucomicrobiota bacterium]